MSEAMCPCKSNIPSSQCCEKFINGSQKPESVEELMRSRYTAFTKGAHDYLMETWHPETRPDSIESDLTNWLDLKIVDSSQEGHEGEVEFIAKLYHNNKLEVLHELSFFEKVDGHWVYYNGEFKEKCAVEKISKNSLCPCGSDLKFKRCHGA